MIRYYGQYIAAGSSRVTFESAKAAADARARDLHDGETQRQSLISNRIASPTSIETTRGRASSACRANAAIPDKRLCECPGEARPDLCHAG